MNFTHFYSDPHYGHANIIEHAHRPFADVDDMNAELEERYRAAVGPNDHVLWFGDCAWTGFDLKALLSRLPGRKSLIIGNHDGSKRRMLNAGFELVADQLTVVLAGQTATLCHYPPLNATYGGREYDDRFVARRPAEPAKGQLVVHGHTHELTCWDGRRVHIGVDAWDFAPVPVHTLELKLAEQGYRAG